MQKPSFKKSQPKCVPYVSRVKGRMKKPAKKIGERCLAYRLTLFVFSFFSLSAIFVIASVWKGISYIFLEEAFQGREYRSLTDCTDVRNSMKITSERKT